MAINKKLIHFKKYTDFVGSSGINGATSPTKGYYNNIPETSIVFIQDTNQIWTHGTFYDGSTVDLSTKQDVISDLDTIRSGAAAGATALQSETDPTVPTWAKAATKPTYTAAEVGALPSTTTIPTKTSQLTNDSGFTSNTGTITGITMNGASKGSSGVVNLGTVITDVSGKQDKNLYFTNQSASSWVSDNTYSDFPYRCDIACTGVTADMYAEVIFDVTEAQSGNYAPVCETKNGSVAIWSKENTEIQIPTIIITK